jgi:plasmid stability protein
MATTDNNLRVPDDLLAELQIKANADGKTVDKIAEEALREGLEERSLLDLVSQAPLYIGTVRDSDLEDNRAEYRNGHSQRG